MEKSLSVRKKMFIIAAIIIAAALIRLYNINGALFDFNPLRQAVNAFISRNYAFNPNAMFLLPAAHNMGPDPGYFMFELPVVQYMISFFVKIFGANNWVFRVPFVFFFMMSAIFFYKLCSKILDFKTSALALVFYSIAPMSILMGRVFQIESCLLFVMFASIYYFIEWLENEKDKDLLISTIGLTVLVLIKITNLYVLIFLFALFFIYNKPRLILRSIIPLIFVLSVNYFWWGMYSNGIREMFPTEYTVTSDNVNRFTPKNILAIMRTYSLSSEYWILTAKHTFLKVFSPPLFILLLGGICVRKKKRLQLFLLSWIGSVFVFLFVFSTAARQIYYKIHLVPVGSIFIAICFLWLFEKIKTKWGKVMFSVISGIVIMASIFIIVYPVIRVKPIFQQQEELGEKVEALSDDGDLVVATFGPDALLLFYCNRRGWSQYLNSVEDNIGLLEQRRKDGATYFVCGNLNEFDFNPEFKEYMLENYELISAEDMKCDEPDGFSIDHLIWKTASKFNSPIFAAIKKRIERRSMGHVIFDLKEKTK